MLPHLLLTLPVLLCLTALLLRSRRGLGASQSSFDDSLSLWANPRGRKRNAVRNNGEFS